LGNNAIGQTLGNGHIPERFSQRFIQPLQTAEPTLEFRIGSQPVRQKRQPKVRQVNAAGSADLHRLSQAKIWHWFSFHG